MAQLVITAVGPDRPGIVGELTGHLHTAGANLLDSRMVNLRGEFAILVLLESDPDAARRLAKELPSIGQQMGLRLTVSEQAPAAATVQGLPYKLKTYSLDQPGIVARLTKVLREHGVNIEELSAWQESAPFAGGALFLTEMRLTVPRDVAVVKLRQALESLGNELNCSVDLDPEG